MKWDASVLAAWQINTCPSVYPRMACLTYYLPETWMALPIKSIGHPFESRVIWCCRTNFCSFGLKAGSLFMPWATKVYRYHVTTKDYMKRGQILYDTVPYNNLVKAISKCQFRNALTCCAQEPVGLTGELRYCLHILGTLDIVITCLVRDINEDEQWSRQLSYNLMH